MFLHSSHIWEKSGSWDIDQKALDQSAGRIFKSTISLEQNDDIARFFTCQYKFMKIKCWLKNFWVGMVKNRCDHFGQGIQRSSVSQKQTDRVTWFLHADTNLRKLKVTLIIFWWVWSKMGMAF